MQQYDLKMCLHSLKHLFQMYLLNTYEPETICVTTGEKYMHKFIIFLKAFVQNDEWINSLINYRVTILAMRVQERVIKNIIFGSSLGPEIPTLSPSWGLGGSSRAAKHTVHVQGPEAGKAFTLLGRNHEPHCSFLLVAREEESMGESQASRIGHHTSLLWNNQIF